MWLRVMILLVGLCFFPLKSFAVSCTVSPVPNVAFTSAVSPFNNTSDTVISVNVNYTCTGAVLSLLGATICFNFGPSANGSTFPRQMTSGTAKINYQLYQDSGHTIVLGNQDSNASFSPKRVAWRMLTLNDLTGSFTVYAVIPKGQSTAVPGNYTDNFLAINASITSIINPLNLGAACGSTVVGNFAFGVTATVSKQCQITATNTLSLGSVAYTQTNITSNSNFTMACTNGTAYTIGLTPSNGNTTGSGVMKSTATTSTNPDLVPYQLKSTAGVSGLTWGNASPNLVADTGTGSSVNKTVYALVPNANYRADSYADTVTITVTY
ncbi:spore coat protein U domain-containing protein [Kluyvera sp. 142486]|uniref:Csu type fimbrial protein n=1 Tax=Kluyvera sp. 142486 TaxID=3390050 RepID=UPI0039817BF5